MTDPILVVEPNTTNLAPLLVSGLRDLFKGNLLATRVRQSRLLTNCPLPAILASMAHASPARLQKMISDRPANAESWFKGREESSLGHFKNIDRLISVRFPSKEVEVTPLLFCDSAGSPRFAKSIAGDGWVSYIEKAYVVYRCQGEYENMAMDAKHPPTVERVVKDLMRDYDKVELTSDTATFFGDLEEGDNGWATAEWQELRGRQVTARLSRVLEQAHRRATVATTPSDTQHLIGRHTVAVLGFANGSVELFDAMQGRIIRLRLQQFVQDVDAVYQARP